MNVITDFFSKGQKIGLAVSGGMDSMALLHWFFENKQKLGISIVVINIDHDIRSTSYEDSAFVQDYCQKIDVPCLFYKLDRQKLFKNNVENSARLERYAIFHELIEKKEVDYIATAHHAKDNAETVLLHLFRGCGLKGAGGISLKTPKGIIRPLLYTPKEEIIQYINDNNIPYVTDETNLCTDYDRNFIRLEILPKIEERFKEAVKNINSFSKTAKVDNEFIEQYVPRQKVNNNELFIPLEHFNFKDSIINREILNSLNSLGIHYDIDSSHIELVKSLVLRPAGTKLDIKNGIIALRDYNGITLIDKSNLENDEFLDFSVPFGTGKIKLPNGVLEVELMKNDFDDINFLKNLQEQYLDADNLPSDCVIRFRRAGDCINKFGGSGKVSLKEYFIDKKILARKRNRVPLLAKKNQIYAIIGISVSQEVKITSQTQNIYKLKFLEEQ